MIAPVEYRGEDLRTGVEYLLTVWPDGGMTMASRDLSRGELSWSPPVALTLEPVEATS